MDIKKYHRHAKTYNDKYNKPQQKHHLGTAGNITGWLKSILRAFVLPWYTQDICSVRVKSSQQCSISENIKKRIQRWNNDKDSIEKNNWNAAAKENQQ